MKVEILVFNLHEHVGIGHRTQWLQRSGGPVVQDGQLIGLNTQVLGGGKVTANENYALPAYLLREPVFNVFARK